MEELNDKDFDQLFRTRITEEIPEFEEQSWLKMERKLRRRDRTVFLRYASIILLLLSFGVTIFLIQRNVGEMPLELAHQSPKNHANQHPEISPDSTQTFALTNNLTIKKKNYLINKPVSRNLIPAQQTAAELKNPGRHDVLRSLVPLSRSPKISGNTPQAIQLSNGFFIAKDDRTTILEEMTLPEKNRRRRKLPISLALAAGPDFNSTTAAVGGKTNVAFGLGIGIALSKKWSIQTGLNYGHKNYDANGSNYTFNNPNTKNIITTVNAACEVIEIPLRASLNVIENQKRSIEINAGLSSYFMLKENYVYKYTPESGRADRLVEAVNENQHILSVVDLSATYHIKLKNKKLAFGIEPYVKIPLSGIGEGRVPLKSSGIALKLRYDFNRN